MKFTVHVDKTPFTQKPVGGEIGGIRIRLDENHSQNSLKEIEVAELVELIRTGCTIQPCNVYSERKQLTNANGSPKFKKDGSPERGTFYEYKGQWIFFLDIDNETEDIFDFDRIAAVLSENGLCAAIVYHTFSSTPEHEKFRVCILLDAPVTDETERDKIIHTLMKLFGQAIDKSCTDKPRMFFGSPDSILWDEGDTCSKETILKLNDKLFPQEQSETIPELPLNYSPIPSPSALHTGLDKTISPDFDPDVLLDMIDPNDLEYNPKTEIGWISVSSSYKHYSTGQQSFEHWMQWNQTYSHNKEDANRRTWDGLNGEGITDGTLKEAAKRFNPSDFHTYADSVNDKSRELKQRKASKQFNGNQTTGNNQLMQWTEVKEKPNSRRLPEIKFPVGVFPDWIEKFIDSACGHIQVDRAMIGSAVLATSALACQGRFNVMHPSGNGHKEELPLFIAISADPGERKSSSLEVAYRPIKNFEMQSEAQYNQDLAQFTAQSKLLNLQENQAEKTLSRPPEKLGDSDREYAEKVIQQAELDKLNLQKKKPQSPHILMDDATPEAVLRRMQETGGNVGTFTAESGFIQILAGMYNNGSANIDLILKSYSRERYTCDRVTRGTQTIESPTQTICAFVQPSLYSTLLSNETFRGRGFSARFLTCRPEKRAGTIDHSNNTQLDATAQKQYDNTILEIMKNPFVENPTSIRWEQTAANFAIDYMNTLERTMLKGGTMETATDYAAKAAGRYVRICGILHLLRNYNHPTESISMDTAEKAQELHDYYFRQSEIEVDAADNMEDKITELIESAIIDLTEHGKKAISVREIWRKIYRKNFNGKNVFNDRTDFDNYLDSIEESGKIQVISAGKRKDVHVNPFWMKSITN